MHLLFLCSQNKRRSLTAEKLFDGYDSHSARSAGTETNARVKVTPGLLGWADVINKLEREQLISLAAAYDPEENRTVWNVQKLRESFRSAQQLKQGLADYVDEFETVELDSLLN